MMTAKESDGVGTAIQNRAVGILIPHSIRDATRNDA